jgi:small subunit ribosomal protein S16
MAVTLRLARRGAKKAPFYHVVATDSRNPRDGKFTEQIGTYDPSFKPAKINIDAERLAHWIKMGAQPSDTVRSLIKQAKKSPAAPAKG